jgi:hypothetical protein
VTLLHPFRRNVATTGPVAIPATPTVVYAETIGRFTTVHDLNPDRPVTGCQLALWPFWRLTLADARRFEPHFCDRCWPSWRCTFCGVPSGEADECRRCLTDSLNIDARIAGAA